jgi:hypothetical protein
MKKIVVLLAVLALMLPNTLVLAKKGGRGGSGAVKKLVNCCFPDGGCVKTNRENCELKKAQVVTDCAQCKSAKKAEPK